VAFRESRGKGGVDGGWTEFIVRPLPGYKTWIGGLLLFGVAAIVALGISIFRPEIFLTPQRTTLPKAHAREASFLDRLHAAGMPLTDDVALMLGRATCTDLGNGIPMSAVLASNNPGVGGPVLTAAQNWELLSVAVSELCPELWTGY
jgi:hypothetical protein